MNALDERAVFLSYASQDAEAARKICAALRAAGVEVWLDQDALIGGDAWDQKIRAQINACALFLPIVSAATQARREGYFRLEWKLAAQRTHMMSERTAFLLPVVPDATTDAEADVPPEFRAVQWTRIPGGDTPETFCARVKGLMEGAAVAPVFDRRSEAEATSNAMNRTNAGQRPALPRKHSPVALSAAGFAVVVAIATAVFVAKKPAAPAAALATTAPVTANPIPASPLTTATGATAAIDPKSIAVLAFENVSDDKANEYFSDGISEELLTVLQKIPGLHVAARASAFSFKGKGATVQEIGAKLGVAQIVEGSVRKRGNDVRITVRLSRAVTGEQVWSENYTRGLNDIFAVQSEIALTVVGQLRGQLGGPADAAAKAALEAQVQAAEKGGTRNAAAHEQYLQGRFFLNQYLAGNLARAVAYFHHAVELDPDYALAWAALSKAYSLQGEYSPTIAGIAENFTAARHAADQALVLAPTLAEGFSARMEIQYAYDFDWRGARASLQRALELAPADPKVLASAAKLAVVFDEPERGIAFCRQALALDPVNVEIRAVLAGFLARTDRFAESDAERRRVLEISLPDAHGQLSLNYTAQGRYDEAVAEAEKEVVDGSKLLALAFARSGQKHSAEADAALAQIVKDYGEAGAFQIAGVYAYRGDADRAFDWLERAYGHRDGGLSLLRGNLWLRKLHADPRWPVLLHKMGLADEQLK